MIILSVGIDPGYSKTNPGGLFAGVFDLSSMEPVLTRQVCSMVTAMLKGETENEYLFRATRSFWGAMMGPIGGAVRERTVLVVERIVRASMGGLCRVEGLALGTLIPITCDESCFYRPAPATWRKELGIPNKSETAKMDAVEMANSYGVKVLRGDKHLDGLAEAFCLALYGARLEMKKLKKLKKGKS